MSIDISNACFQLQLFPSRVGNYDSKAFVIVTCINNTVNASNKT